MKLIAPDYYGQFACIAGACKHSCCIGWEIDIDSDTLDFYRSVKGDFGKRLRAGIVYENGDACFRLGDGERCPFLNENGLCDIILHLGEEHLSQICTDHPRFCSFYSDRTEIGLGLCCEESARLLLSRQNPIKLTVLQDDGEQEIPSEREKQFFEKRELLFSLLQDRTQSLSSRLRNIGNSFMSGQTVTQDAMPELLRSLEIMDPKWEKLLSEVKVIPQEQCANLEKFEVAFEQIFWYFCYRYVSDPACFIEKGVDFAFFSFRIIRLLFSYLGTKGHADMETLIELCRMYSCEIEYSEENIEKISSIITKDIFLQPHP